MVSREDNTTDSRRSFLKNVGFGVAGISGVTGLSLVSQPSLALSENVKLPTGLVEGTVTIPSYEIQYSNLDPDEDITIEYILTIDGSVEPESEWQTHTVPITDRNGSVMTGEHSINIPAGEIGLQIQLSHSSTQTSSEVTESTNATTVNPSTQIIESFEDGSLSEYTAHNSGSSYYEGGSETVSNDVSYEGTQSLKFSLNGENGNRQLSTDSGPNSNLPTRGDTFKYYVYFADSDIRRTGVKFATDDPTSGASRGYNVRTNVSESNFSIGAIHRDNSSVTSWNPPLNEWIEIVVEFNNPTISVTAYDSGENSIASASIDDSDYDSGWWTWYANTNSASNGGVVYFDNLLK